MQNWRETFNTTAFKPYRSNKGTDLQNMAEFTGDKIPSTGDPSKIELNSWHSGNEVSKKDRVEESKSTGGSPLLNTSVKRTSTPFQKNATNLNWRAVLGNVNFEQKPDGTIKIDVDYSNENAVVNDTAGAIPAATPSVSPPAATSPVAVNKKASSINEWEIKSKGDLKLLGKECADSCGIFISKSGSIIDSQRVAKSSKSREWHELINQGVWETKFDSMSVT